ncbi:MAG: hypothetical protein OEM63_00340 [Gammaproteobacteria bacterium]|nr:hypothetical protein [Gammaproteobacteria bacterium]
MDKRAALVLAMFVLIACAPAPLRSFDNGLLVSRATPAMSVRIASDFEYLGPETFLLGETHEAERHHFVKRDANEVTGLLVFQFERILDGVPGKYEFNVPPEEHIAGSNYRFALQPVRLGSHDYVHNTWAFNTRESARENPGRESDRTLKLLDERGYKIDDGLIMARYVRAIGEDQRNEVIIFYMEPLDRNGHDIRDFPDGGPKTESFDRLSSAIVARARSAFEVLPTE